MRTSELFDRTELRAARPLLADEADPLEALARAAWSSLAEPGDAVAATLIDSVGAPAALAHVIRSSSAADILAEIEGSADELTTLAAGLERWRPRVDRALLRRRVEIARRLDARLLIPGSEGWPESLDDLGPHAPLVLWIRGDPSALSARHRVAVVGARAATGYGEHVAAELAAGAADRGALVVSGGAFGIDAVAHRAALGTGGRTVAFLAGGADRLYPTAHSDLLHRIIATPGSAVVTEVPPGTTPTRWRFLQRNRLIAASTAVTVVVEAGARSGSLNTAGHAAALGRPLGAVPGPVTSASSAGCHRLLREYAATCVTSTSDVLELLGLAETPVADSEPLGPASRVMDALRGRGPHDSESVARHSGCSVADTLAVLGALLADGHVHRTDDGGWEAVRR
ncbi:DNA protecting protein DprA [Rathayibacter oskolensis]|uniref:DNA protecting protein DprA n=1 Tax=Rathayibacter oskolensis TaxID=1891671 RepID=A0A1X7NGP9_9MICO|nr:DNA-processing protein DprA [Rathayibacter oskolensis]SMH36915.1 DNA protecting protein DprA [Rathayibacter oskolensis]